MKLGEIVAVVALAFVIVKLMPSALPADALLAFDGFIRQPTVIVVLAVLGAIVLWPSSKKD